MRKLAALAVLIALAGAVPCQAAGPYRVFRVTASSAAATAETPLATLATATPFVDPTLNDGVSYYYVVRDGLGATLDVRLEADRAAGTVQVAFDGSGTLRDDAVGTAHDLFGPAGLLATMAASAPGTPVAAALTDARLDGLAALDDLGWNTGQRDDNALQTWLDACLRALAEAKADPSPFTAQQIADIEDRVLELARALVTYRLELAEGACGVCNPQTPAQKVCQARAALDHGNALRSTDGTPSQVVDAYAESIRASLQAIHFCDGV